MAFAHGLNIHFQLIEARPDLDMIMIAGAPVTIEYLKGAGVPTLIAVDRDASGNAQDIALSYFGNGGGRAGIIETTFKEEWKPTCSVSRPFSVAVSRT